MWAFSLSYFLLVPEKKNMKKEKYMYLLALLPFLLVAFLYEIVPLIMIIVNSFQPDAGGGFTLENYQTVFTQLL